MPGFFIALVSSAFVIFLNLAALDWLHAIIYGVLFGNVTAILLLMLFRIDAGKGEIQSDKLD